MGKVYAPPEDIKEPALRIESRESYLADIERYTERSGSHLCE